MVQNVVQIVDEAMFKNVVPNIVLNVVPNMVLNVVPISYVSLQMWFKM